MLFNGARAWMHAIPFGLALIGATSDTQASQARVEEALTNIITLQRPDQIGLATVWDGNKYVQCRPMADRSTRCEAAGTLMQPSLGHVLNPDRIARLKALGWTLNANFGNYMQDFPGSLSASELTGRILSALREGYDADVSNLEIKTDWVKNVPCPPRNGPTQNLAGMINDSASMTRVVVRDCIYQTAAGQEPAAQAISAVDLINAYGTRVGGEIQRLRVNKGNKVFVVFDTGGGYIQCAPQTEPFVIYCEAQSAESWPVLARILTADRVARLRRAGFAEPGRAPNYWKIYPADKFSDANIADELLTILFDAYGYNGSPALRYATEKGRH